MLVAAESNISLVGPQGVSLVGHGLGEFGGTASIQQMQKALLNLSQAAGWPAANPGTTSGSVTTQTISAVAAVVANLAELSSSIKTALQAALAIAMVNDTARATAINLITSYSAYITPAVMALTMKYAKAPAPPPAPPPPTPPSTTVPSVGQQTMLTPAQMTATKGPLPAGAIQARSKKTGLWRVAVPQSMAPGLGGPAIGLGAAYHELPSRATMTAGIPVVSEGDLAQKTGSLPWYKNWKILGGIGAGVLVLGGGTYYMVRRR